MNLLDLFTPASYTPDTSFGPEPPAMLPMSPHERAAARTRRGVAPPGGRPEGLATMFLERAGPAVAQTAASSLESALTLPQRAFEASNERLAGGGYDPGPSLEAALLAMGGTAAGAPRGAVGAGPVKPGGLDLTEISRVAGDVSAQRGGFSAVPIADLVRATGATPEAVHQALLREAKAGNLTLHHTTLGSAAYPEAERAAWLRLPQYPEPFVTFTVKRQAPAAPREPQSLGELEALFRSSKELK